MFDASCNDNDQPALTSHISQAYDATILAAQAALDSSLAPDLFFQWWFDASDSGTREQVSKKLYDIAASLQNIGVNANGHIVTVYCNYAEQDGAPYLGREGGGQVEISIGSLGE